MALRSRKNTEVVPVAEQPQEVMAAAVRLTSIDAELPYRSYTDEAWQREAWQFYDCNGELHFAAEYVGSACQMVRLYIRHVTENGELGKEVEDDPAVSSIAISMMGGPARKSEVLNNIATGLTVAGETYLIGRQRSNGIDEWVTVAPMFCRPSGGVYLVDFGNGVFVTIDPNVDVVARVWTPHKARPLLADCSTRALLLSFAQLQKLRMFMSAELNSRIANGSLYPLPDNLKFPGDAANNVPPGAPGVAQLLFEAMTTNISGYGTAAQVAPIIFEAPVEAIAAMKDKPIRFDSPLSDHAMDYRRELIDDVARGMNVPAGTLSASAMQGLNHWSAWWGSEEFITKTVAPMMLRICDALNKTYLAGALRRLGKDPSRYTVWFDVAPLSNTANQLADALNMFNASPELLSAETVRAAGNYNDSNAPSPEEVERRRLWGIVERDPTLLHIEGVREKLGVDIPNFAPPLTTGTDLDRPGPPPPPAPERTQQLRTLGRPPERAAETDGIESSIVSPSPLLGTANAVVLAALAIGGRRLRTAPYRSMFNDVDPTIMHTKIKVSGEDHAMELLASAWTTAEPSLAYINIDPKWILPKLEKYAVQVMCAEIEHSPGLLARFLANEGVVV
jgi:hypothetical protein